MSVTGHKKHSDVGSQLSYLFRDRWSVHRRHDHVGQDEVDLSNVRRRLLYRLSTAGCGEDGVAVASQYPLRNFALPFFVIDYEDRLCSPQWLLVI